MRLVPAITCGLLQFHVEHEDCPENCEVARYLLEMMGIGRPYGHQETLLSEARREEMEVRQVF